MPSTSTKQKIFMRICCHNPEIAKANGISQELACEWMEEDQKQDKRSQHRQQKPKGEKHE